MPTKLQARISWSVRVPLGVWLDMGAPSFRRERRPARYGGHVVPVVHGGDEEIAEEADDQQRSHQIHGDVVGVGLRNSTRNLVRADVVDQYRTEHPGSGPGGEQQSVNRADITRPEHVLEICRQRGESATVHADDDEEEEDEKTDAAQAPR